MQMRLRTVCGLLLTTLWSGCAMTNPTADNPPLEGTSWVLVSMPGWTLTNGAPATLYFQAGRVSGSDGCNRFTGPYTVKGSAIELPERPEGTLIGCPASVQKQAEAYMRALAGAKSYLVADGRLQLLGADGTLVVTLAAQSQELMGTAWRVTSINNGKNAVASVRAGTNVTLAFASNGQAAGSAGCNTFDARYESGSGRLKFLAPILATCKICASSGLMEQEHAFLKALEAVSSSRIEGGRLELRGANGELQIMAMVDAGG